MKCIQFDGTDVPLVADSPEPILATNTTLLRVLRAGICGTDLSILSGRHPRATPPLILGHELAARVEAVDGAAAHTHGDVVTVEPILCCGECIACRSGFSHVCENLRLYGIDQPGGMAEYIVVHNDRVIGTDFAMDPDAMVLAEPLAVAVHSVRIGDLRYGDQACVIGGGPIGLMIGLLLKESTASPVIVSEPHPGRRAIAESLGFAVVDPTQRRLTDEINRIAGRETVDIVYEAAGSQAAILDATKILRPRGTVVQVSIPKEARNVSIVDVTFKELIMKGVRVYEPGDFDKAIDFLRRNANVVPALIGGRYRLEDAADAFAAARAGDSGLRVLFHLD